MSDTKVMRVPLSVLETLRELSNRTGLDMVDILTQIFGTVQKQLDLMEANKRLLFMADLYTLDNVPKTIIRLSDAMAFGLDQIPSELRSDILKAFGYSTDGKFTDLREVNKDEKKEGAK